MQISWCTLYHCFGKIIIQFEENNHHNSWINKVMQKVAVQVTKALKRPDRQTYIRLLPPSINSQISKHENCSPLFWVLRPTSHFKSWMHPSKGVLQYRAMHTARDLIRAYMHVTSPEKLQACLLSRFTVGIIRKLEQEPLSFPSKHLKSSDSSQKTAPGRYVEMLLVSAAKSSYNGGAGLGEAPWTMQAWWCQILL